MLDLANDIQVKLPGSYERGDTDIAKAARIAACFGWFFIVTGIAMVFGRAVLRDRDDQRIVARVHRLVPDEP